MNTYRLTRGPGCIIFNSFGLEEKYWLSYLAAAQGGRPMYTEISKSDFESVFQNEISIRDLHDAVVFPSTLDSDLEKSKEEKYSLLHAIGVHNLKAGDMPMPSVIVCA